MVVGYARYNKRLNRAPTAAVRPKTGIWLRSATAALVDVEEAEPVLVPLEPGAPLLVVGLAVSEEQL